MLRSEWYSQKWKFIYVTHLPKSPWRAFHLFSGNTFCLCLLLAFCHAAVSYCLWSSWTWHVSHLAILPSSFWHMFFSLNIPYSTLLHSSLNCHFWKVPHLGSFVILTKSTLSFPFIMLITILICVCVLWFQALWIRIVVCC